MTEITEDNGNGSGGDKRAVFDLETIQRPDGIIPTSLLNMGRESSGVLASAMRAIEKNDQYRQELKTGYFTSPTKAMQMVLAIDECREVGIEPTLVVDLLIAQKAGVKGGLLHDIFEALTHTSFSTNYRGGNNGSKWRGNGDSRNPSPLS